MVKEVTEDFNKSECMLGADKNYKIKVFKLYYSSQKIDSIVQQNFWINVTMFSGKGTLLLQANVSKDFFYFLYI